MHQGTAAPQKPTYLEIGGRFYELYIVDGYPRNSRGEERRCLADLSAQTIHISRHVAPQNRAAVVAKTLGYEDSLNVWRLLEGVNQKMIPASH